MEFFEFIEDAPLDEKIRRVVQFATGNSAFYRVHFYGYDVQGASDLAKAPSVSADQHRAAAAGYPSTMCTGPETNCYVFSSSGTSGTPKYIFRSHVENAINAQAIAKGFLHSGMQPGDSVLSMLFGGRLWAGMTVFNAGLEHVGVMMLNAGDRCPPNELVDLIRRFRVTCLLGLPTQILSFVHFLEGENITDVNVPKIYTGGERLFPAAQERIFQVLGVEHAYSLGYAANDTGALAYSCIHSKPGVFHAHANIQHIELVGENGEPVPHGEAGDVVVTTLYRSLMPVIRFQVGDRARWVDGRCSCGDPNPLLQLEGRSDDMLRMGPTAYVTPELVSNHLAEVPGLSNHFQIIADVDERGLDRLNVHVEMIAEDGDADALSKAVREQLMQLRGLGREIDNHRIGDLVVRVLPPGTIERNPRTGKIKVSVDRRAE